MLNRYRLLICLSALAAAPLGASLSARQALADYNLHLIDRDEATGFEIYRTGKPNAQDFVDLCDLGVTEMMVLSGNASEVEDRFHPLCPQMKVIYDIRQKANEAVDIAFLGFFDQWVDDARHTGKKIAFRCNCGCHRTGRLAAYYQIKYQGITATDAKIIMRKHGKWMLFYPFLFKQVDAMEDFIAGRPCST